MKGPGKCFDPFELIRRMEAPPTAEEEWAKSQDASLTYEQKKVHLKAAAKIGHRNAQLCLGTSCGLDDLRRGLKWLFRAYLNKEQPALSGKVCYELGRLFFDMTTKMPADMTTPEFVAELEARSFTYFKEASETHHNDYATAWLAERCEKAGNRAEAVKWYVKCKLYEPLVLRSDYILILRQLEQATRHEDPGEVAAQVKEVLSLHQINHSKYGALSRDYIETQKWLSE